MKNLKKYIRQNEAGNAGIALLVIGGVIVLWVIMESILGIIGSNFDEKRQKNREREEMRMKANRPQKAFQAKDRGTVVRY